MPPWIRTAIKVIALLPILFDGIKALLPIVADLWSKLKAAWGR